MDHFARLGLPAALDLEPAALDRAYFTAQRQWHPDRFVGRPPEERAKASLFLIGTEMDYVEEKLKSGFVFTNPNEKGRCGCGESFHV